jgi:ureidoglycolate lyase
MSHLITQPLTSEAFAAFGQVIDTSGEDPRSINDGGTDRFHDLAELDFGDLHGRPCLSIFRAQPQTLPFVVRMLERHTLSTQAFVPLEPARFLIVGAKPG